MQSCLYEGVVSHHRRSPTSHRLRRRVYMAYLDLDETDWLADRGILPQRRAYHTYRDRDHVGGADGDLKDSLLQFLSREHGLRPGGPVRLLTQLRVMGLYFSPLNLYYCFDSSGVDVQAVVAEVSNTPWNERRRYVLSDLKQSGRPKRLAFAHPKDFHVSPFMPMDMTYHWRLTEPGQTVGVRIQAVRADRVVLNATMALNRRQLSPANLSALALRHPVAPVQIVGGIYYHALKLWCKKCPTFPHPLRTGNPPNHSSGRVPEHAP